MRSALEDLRTADRILMSVQGTTGFLVRQQTFDLFGAPTADGLFGGQTRADNDHASEELINAQIAMKTALAKLGLDPELAPTELKRWGRLDDIFDGVFMDFLALRHARSNHASATQVRSRVRALFAQVCEMYPDVSVPPLEQDEDYLPEASSRVPWRWIFAFAAAAAYLLLG